MSERKPLPLGPPHFCAWCRQRFDVYAGLLAHGEERHADEYAVSRAAWEAAERGDHGPMERLVLALCGVWIAPSGGQEET